MNNCILSVDFFSVSPLSEISPPSISITGPIVSNPSPRTSCYYFATPEGSYLTRESTITPTSTESPNKEGEYDNSVNSERYEQDGTSADSNQSTGLLKERFKSSPVALRRSLQVRRHQDGFVLKESLSPQSLDHLQDEEMLSQSPKEGSIYFLDIVRPLSNTDQALLNLKSEDSKMFSCSPTDVALSPSPSSSSPKMSVISNNFSGKPIESTNMCVLPINDSNSSVNGTSFGHSEQSNAVTVSNHSTNSMVNNLEFCDISKGSIQVPDD